MPRRKNTADCYDVFVNIWRKREEAAKVAKERQESDDGLGADRRNDDRERRRAARSNPMAREITSRDLGAVFGSPSAGASSMRRPLLGAPKNGAPRNAAPKNGVPRRSGLVDRRAGGPSSDGGGRGSTGLPSSRLLSGGSIDLPATARGGLPRWIEHPGGELSRFAGAPASFESSVPSSPVGHEMSPTFPQQMPQERRQDDVPGAPVEEVGIGHEAATARPLVIELLEAREPFRETQHGPDDRGESAGPAEGAALRWGGGDSAGGDSAGGDSAGSDSAGSDSSGESLLRAPDAPVESGAGSRRLPPDPEDSEDGASIGDPSCGDEATPTGSTPARAFVGVWSERVRTLLRRLPGWTGASMRGAKKFTSDDFGASLGQSVRMRVSTLILFALSFAIVLGLIGLWLRSEPPGSNLHQRFFDERAGSSAANGSPGSSDGDLESGAGAIVRPVWSREDGERPAEFRQPSQGDAGSASPGASGAETGAAGTSSAGTLAQSGIPEPETPETRWLRVRAQMDKEECVKLLDHLARLREHLESRVGCVEQSIACKRFEPELTDTLNGARYTVDIGPFTSYRMAQQAASELRQLTGGGSWRFKNRSNYFHSAYVYNRSRD